MSQSLDINNSEQMYEMVSNYDVDTLLSVTSLQNDPFVSSLATAAKKLSKEEFINIHQQFVRSTNEREERFRKLTEENQRLQERLSSLGGVEPSQQNCDGMNGDSVSSDVSNASASFTNPFQMMLGNMDMDQVYDTLMTIDTDSLNPFAKDLVCSFRKFSKEQFIVVFKQILEGNIESVIYQVSTPTPLACPNNLESSQPTQITPPCEFICNLEKQCERQRESIIKESSMVANTVMNMIESSLDRSDNIRNTNMRLVSILDKFAISLDVLCGVVPSIRENLDIPTLARVESVKTRLSNVITDMMNVFLEE